MLSWSFGRSERAVDAALLPDRVMVDVTDVSLAG
jgi:hypothetical protein